MSGKYVLYFPSSSARALFNPNAGTGDDSYNPYFDSLTSIILPVEDILDSSGILEVPINLNDLLNTTPNYGEFYDIPGWNYQTFRWTDGSNTYTPGDDIPAGIGDIVGGDSSGDDLLAGGDDAAGGGFDGMTLIGPGDSNPYSSLFSAATTGTVINGRRTLILYPAPFQDIPCFKEDTKILTDKGYKQIKDLRKGDMVKTLKEGYIPVNAVGYTPFKNNPSHNRIKNQLYVYQKDKFPELTEDLVLTGSHSVLVKEFVGDQRKMVNNALGGIYITESRYRLPAYLDDRADIYTTKGSFNVYHLCLDGIDPKSNHGIYANGLLAETCFIRELKTDRWTLL